MKDLLKCVGLQCKKGHEIKVLRSEAGYYVGTVDEDGCPNCRLSQYYGQSPDDPIMNAERDCMENQFCNGDSISGCQVSIMPKVREFTHQSTHQEEMADFLNDYYGGNL